MQQVGFICTVQIHEIVHLNLGLFDYPARRFVSLQTRVKQTRLKLQNGSDASKTFISWRCSVLLHFVWYEVHFSARFSTKGKYLCNLCQLFSNSCQQICKLCTKIFKLILSKRKGERRRHVQEFSSAYTLIISPANPVTCSDFMQTFGTGSTCLKPHKAGC